VRVWFLVACGSLPLVGSAAAACANAEDDELMTPQPDAAPTEPVDVPDSSNGPDAAADAQDDAALEQPRCSSDGWCATALPDTDLLVKDIWALPGYAFAVAESPTLGVKVLEWSDARSQWDYIDDFTQNEPGGGRYAGKIWAPNEDEVYYGVAPGYVYHGLRPKAPATRWSWERGLLGTINLSNPDEANPSYWKNASTRVPALGVWGTSSGDVYAWFKNTIYHSTPADGGGLEWIPEYVADDTDAAAEQIYFFDATGTSSNDVWFAGGRSRSSAGCAVVVHKTASKYERIADGVLTGNSSPCATRAGTLMIGGTEGWLTNIQALGPSELIGLKGARDVARISSSDVGYSVALASVPTKVTASGLNSLSAVANDLWLGGSGVVVRGDNVWDGGTYGGAYELSSIALNGPLGRAIYQVRGTSNNNLWAIGVRYALHKTTP